MKKMNKVSFLALLLLLGCSANNPDSTLISTPIEKIINHPENYKDKTVVIIGTVQQSIGISDKTAFKIDDNTGAIWVMSENSFAPETGSNIKVRGEPRQWIRFGNKSIIVLYAREE